MATESNCVNEKGGQYFGFPVINGEFLKNLLVPVKLAYGAQLLRSGVRSFLLIAAEMALGNMEELCNDCLLRMIFSDLGRL